MAGTASAALAALSAASVMLAMDAAGPLAWASFGCLLGHYVFRRETWA